MRDLSNLAARSRAPRFSLWGDAGDHQALAAAFLRQRQSDLVKHRLIASDHEPAGGRPDVFTDDMIDAYIELRMEEVIRFEQTPHPVEFDMYYSV